MKPRKRPVPPAPTKGPDKRNKQKKKAMRAALAPQAQARAERFYLSPCAKSYLKAICDPFGLDSGLACIPDMRDLPSQKMALKCRGTFTIGTGLFGFVVAAPLINSNAANAVVNSAAGYIPTTVDVSNVNTVGTPLAQNPYSTTSLASGVAGRTVACGLRVRYIGTELNKGGTMAVVRLGTTNTVLNSLNGKSFADVMSLNSVQTVPCDRRWYTVFFVPVNDNDYEYQQNNNNINSTDSLGEARIGFLVSGASAGNTYEWEFIVHKEFVSFNPSNSAVPDLSASHSDAVGMSAIRNYFEGTIDYLGGPKVFQNALAFINKYVPVETSHFATAGSLALAAGRAAGYL